MPAPAERAINKLNALIELDFDASQAYEAAITRLQTQRYRQVFQEHRKDHQKHIEDLSKAVIKLGGEPSKGPNALRLLAKGPAVIAGLVGGDSAVMMAMLANEELITKRYEFALAMNGMDEEATRLVEGNLADEQRHRDWILNRIAQDGHRHHDKAA